MTIISGSLAITIWYALSRGQDFNWDQRNYHIGVPFLLDHGTFWASIAPAGKQSYFNPYVIQIEYFAIQHLNAVVFAIILAVVQSTAFMMAGLICADIGRAGAGAGEREAMSLGLLGFALCLMAPVVLSEAGTTFIDFVTAVPVVAAYALLLFRGGRGLGPMTMTALAGVLIGVATALKLTNGVFALGTIGFAIAGPERLRQRLGWLILCGTSATLAFLALGGSWHLGLWERFHNPFFPFYNNIFHSPDFGGTALHDERFLPHSVLDIWRYPLYWLLGGSPNKGIASPSAEMNFADARWAVMTFSGTALLAALALFPRWRKQRLAEPATGLFFAVVIAYLVWLAEFGNQRYAAPIDILCGAAVLFLAMQIRWPLLRLGVLAAVTVVSWVVLAVPDWGHLPWRPYWQAINPTPLDFDGTSIVFLTEKPTLYIAASLPTAWRYVGILSDPELRADTGTALTRQLEQELVASPDVHLKEVDQGSVPGISIAILARYGLAVTTKCQKLQIANEKLRICNVERIPPTPKPG
jgi:Protein of unknown function (DUF2029).